MRKLVVVLATSLVAIQMSCRDRTPQPSSAGASIPLRVWVVRDVSDAGDPDAAIGYCWTSGHARDLVRQMVNSPLMAGRKINFSWPNEKVTDKLFNFETSSHLWATYVDWTPFISNQPWIRSEPNVLHIVFLPGIIDSSNPVRFMDSYTLDPARNNDPFWTDGDPPTAPVILISDCWKLPWMSNINGADGQGRVPAATQFNYCVVERAVARYFLRLEDYTGTNNNWDDQEYWTGSSPRTTCPGGTSV